MTVFVASLFLPYTVHFELDPCNAAALSAEDDSINEMFEPINKHNDVEPPIDTRKSRSSSILQNSANNSMIQASVSASHHNLSKESQENVTSRETSEDPVSIIQSLSNQNKSSSNLSIINSVDSHTDSILEKHFNNTQAHHDTSDVDSIMSTTSELNNSNIHDDLNTLHLRESNEFHSVQSSGNLKPDPSTLSANDFFFNNPCKTQMSLSSTSVDDPSDTSFTNHSATEKISLNSTVGPMAINDLNIANSSHNSNVGTSSTTNYPYGHSSSPTLVKPKPVLRKVTPQSTVNELSQKRTFMEPKLSSMRINRSQFSNIRNMKTSSILSFDKKLSTDNKRSQGNKDPDFVSAFPPDSYNPDSVFDDYTSSVVNEENVVFDFNNDSGKIAPFGGFSRRYTFTRDMNSIFETSKWKVGNFAKGNGSLIKSIDIARNELPEKFKWIGTVSMPSNIVPQKIKDHIYDELLEKYDSNVIFMDDDIFEGHYKSFCKQILWPIFHYQIPDNPNSNAFENHSWKFYEKLNMIFAQNIAKHYKEGDTIWVHDYHLMLVPKMLREMIPNAKIGFFLHVSFPSSEVFRCLAQRKNILEGMLGADCITFQNEEYMGHFLQSSNKLLLADFNGNGIIYKDRLTVVSYNAIGLDSDSLISQLKSKVVTNWKTLIKGRWPNKKLIVSRDKIDKIRGIKEKLLAYERFLDDYPEYINQTILILICGATGSTDDDYKNEVFSTVERINSKTKNISIDQPIILLNKDIEFEQYLALLSEADLFIVSTLREGMNLTCHEFICATEKRHSPLILSEFVGSASVLTNGPLLSNPYNIKQVKEQIFQCLNMSEKEKLERWTGTFYDIRSHDSKKWVKKCLEDINISYKNSTVPQSFTTLKPLTTSIYQSKLNKYSSCKKLFILNLDDITSSLKIHGQEILNAQRELINQTLFHLSSDTNNYVYILSALKRSELLRFYGRISDIGLIAENGGLIKPPRKNDWYTVIDESEKDWIMSVNEIIKSFCERIPGSYIEIDECTIRFYINNKIDVEYKNGLIGDLITYINEMFAKDNVHASIINNVLIVQESHLITKSLSLVYDQSFEGSAMKRVSSASTFASPVFQAQSPKLLPTNSTGNINVVSSPMLLSSRSSSYVSLFGAVDNKYEFVFTCGSKLRIDEDMYSFFNNISYNSNVESMSVCVSSNLDSKTNATYSLKGANNLLTLLNEIEK